MLEPFRLDEISSLSRIFLRNIWDDINHEAESIVISDISYDPCSLSNIIYDIIDNKELLRKFIKESNIKRLYADIEDIRNHRDKILSNIDVQMLVEGLFKPEHISSITPLDRVFLNAYYRRLLRAKLERDYMGKELVPGLVITEYTNAETDAALIKTLRILRIVCNFLGIMSTTHECTFSISKLYKPAFWFSVSSNFVSLFGEHRITIVDEDDSLDITSMEAYMMIEGQKRIRRTQVLMVLNVIFNTWSGSTLTANDDIIKVTPAKYISRMLPILRDL